MIYESDALGAGNKSFLANMKDLLAEYKPEMLAMVDPLLSSRALSLIPSPFSLFLSEPRYKEAKKDRV